VNSASEEELVKAGVVSRSIGIILDKRPFGTMQAFANTPYIGQKTVEAIARQTK
ncbi:MAG: hypothetical protein HN348_20220, partial [Proteobacteria bacterium]|nr:hypothetical protein [Pseudomonadota bacterium]